VGVFLAGGVPEVMLHLRRLGLLHLDCLTALGRTLSEVLDEWEQSERRRRFRELLRELDGVDPDTVILSPDAARRAGMTGTLAFPVGNVAPQGSVVKSTAIDPGVLDADGVYRMRGRVRVFTTEAAAVAAVKSRFSGVSTGACIGHISPEALAGGPIGKLIDGDLVLIAIDRRTLRAAIDLVGHDGEERDEAWGRSELEQRAVRADVKPDPRLPADTRLWAALQDASGGTWGGCVYDVNAILDALEGARGARNGGT
jgi:dihydroxyacid dehydratase/phosphogluconate dehydratase